METKFDHAIMPGLLSVFTLIFIIFLSGCKSYGPIGTPDFDPTYRRSLEKNEQLLFSAQSGLMVGTYMEGEEELFPVHRGVLLLTSERMVFAAWDDKQQRYEPNIWTGYSYIAKVKKHNNILLQYIAIVATDGNKFTYRLGQQTVDQAYAVLMDRIEASHKAPIPAMPDS